VILPPLVFPDFCNLASILKGRKVFMALRLLTENRLSDRHFDDTEYGNVVLTIAISVTKLQCLLMNSESWKTY
jgi:hypothetical protein